MKRRLINFLSFVSVPLCAAALLLWAQSWFSPKSAKKVWTIAPPSSQPAYYQMMAGGQMVPVYKPRLGAYAVYSQWGRAQVSWGAGIDLPAVLVGFFRPPEWQPDLAPPWRLLGVYVESGRPGSMSQFHYVSSPYWLPAAITAPLAVRGVRVAIEWRRRQRRHAAGCCPGCGYD